MRDTERETETQAREKQAPCREPDVGLDSRTLGSHPGPKADAELLSHPCIPSFALNLDLKGWFTSHQKKKNTECWFLFPY